jgi:DHA2 family multidrug resistance protein
MVPLFLPNDKGKEKGSFDFYGAMALAVSLSSLMLVLEKGQEWEWTSFASILCYFLILVAGALFIKIENKHSSPMIDLKFFKNKNFVSTLLVSFISFGGMMGAMFLLPVFVQTYMGYNATDTGFLFLPMALTLMIAAPIGAKISQKIHIRYCVSLGMFLTALGIYLFSGIDPRNSAMEISFPLVLLAIGMGISMAPLTNAVASSVPDHEVGIASAVLNLVRNIAGALSIALLGTMLTNVTETKVLEVGANTIINNSAYASLVPTLVALKAQVLAYREVFLAAAIVMFVGGFVSLMLRDSSKIKDEKIKEIELET